MDQKSTISPELSTPISGLSKLYAALSKAQAKIEAPVKNRKVDFKDKNGRQVKYSYADLADVMSAIKGPLAENGLAILHQLNFAEDGYFLVTTLGHESGESIATFYPLPNPLTSSIRAQEFGSALTYARRYSVSSLVGIASEEDDDGQIAADTTPPPKKPDSRPIPKAPPVIKKPDPFPPDEAPPADLDDFIPPVTALDELVMMAEEKQIPHDKMKDIIRRTIGAQKRARDLTDEEIFKVMDALKKLF